MKAFLAVVLLAALGLPANLEHLKPHDAVMTVSPMYSAQERQEIYAGQKLSPEYSPNFKQVTEPQKEYGGKVDVPPDDEQQSVTGGITAYRGQFPWQVALVIDNISFCGGSLISSRWVLTAAHCVGNNYLVALGTNKFDGTDDGSLVLNATTTIVHELFNSSTFNNDIALIQLPTTVQFTTYIQPIRLRYIEEDLTGKFLRFSGWGQTSEHSSSSFDLMYADVIVITNTACANTYDSIITPTKICTYDYEDMSACSGDNGGPLVHLESDGVYTQVGIGTFLAVVGCELEYPAGFTRVTSYLSWISAKTGIAIVE